MVENGSFKIMLAHVTFCFPGRRHDWILTKKYNEIDFCAFSLAYIVEQRDCGCDLKTV